MREREEEERKIRPSTMATTFMPAAKGSARTPLGPFAFVCMLISVLIIEEKLLTKNILDKSFEHLITETVFNF